MAAVRCISVGGDWRAAIDGDNDKSSVATGGDRGGWRPGSSSSPVATTVALLSPTQPTIRTVSNGRSRPSNAMRATRRVQICHNHSPPSSAAGCGGDGILTLDGPPHPPSLRSPSMADLAPSIIKLGFFSSKTNASDPTTGDSRCDLNTFFISPHPAVGLKPTLLDGRRLGRVSGGLRVGLWRASSGSWQARDRGRDGFRARAGGRGHEAGRGQGWRLGGRGWASNGPAASQPACDRPLSPSPSSGTGSSELVPVAGHAINVCLSSHMMHVVSAPTRSTLTPSFAWPTCLRPTAIKGSRSHGRHTKLRRK
ncbi:hypothetical protein ACLOJK_008099 [Asimina triloba]